MHNNELKIAILSPVFNDWKSFSTLAGRIAEIGSAINYSLYAVDDGSTEIPQDFPNNTTVIHLRRNMGHQRAIAIGLSFLADKVKPDITLVIDADGEDNPEDIVTLLKEHSKEPQKVLFASRKKRQDGILYKIFYTIYKSLFKILTGNTVDFGNFSLMPFFALEKITSMAELWSHFAGSAIKSGMPIKTIPLEKGHRYHGSSKMNFTSLIFHGLSAVSVHIERVAIRIFFACFFLVICAVILIGIVTYIKFFTDLAAPGWATTIVMTSSIIIVQAFVVSFFIIFLVINNRSVSSAIPFIDYPKYIKSIRNES